MSGGGEQSGASPTVNHVYGDLVRSGAAGRDAILGMIAYALYKKSKREWFNAECKRLGRKPSEEEWRAYASTWTGDRVNGLVVEAEEVLRRFAKELYEGAKSEALQLTQQSALDSVESSVSKGVKTAADQRFWTDVLAGWVSAVVYTGTLVALVGGLYLFGIDVIAGLEKIHNMSPPAH